VNTAVLNVADTNLKEDISWLGELGMEEEDIASTMIVIGLIRRDVVPDIVNEISNAELIVTDGVRVKVNIIE